MARKRMLDPSIWTDDGLAELTPRQQLLYIGLVSNADDQGRLKGNATAIRLMLPGVYGEIESGEIESDLEAVLCNMGKLERYHVASRPYLVFHNYGVWQKIKSPSDSVLPSPEDADSDPVSETLRKQCGNDTEPVPPRARRAAALLETEQKGIEEKRNNARAREAPDKPARKRSVQNDMWDAFVSTLGTEPTTKSERGKWNGAIKELVDAEIQPEAIPGLVKAYRKTFQNISCNPRGLANNLSEIMATNGVRGSPIPQKLDTTAIHELARQRGTGKYREEY